MERAAHFIRKLKLPAGADNPEERAKAAWRLAAGKKIERHTIPARLVRTTLVIEVGDIVWQKQLYALRKPLLKNLAEVLGEPLVTDLDFRPMPPRRGPQQASSHGFSLSSDDRRKPPSPDDEAAGIADPVMALLYRQSQKKRQA